MLDLWSTLAGRLTTTGRVTGRSHTVRLRLVDYQGRLYASRRDTHKDWCRNALKNPAVSVELTESRFDGIAALVTDGDLIRKISQIMKQYFGGPSWKIKSPKDMRRLQATKSAT